MAKNRRYTVKFRRRLAGKTNYKKRLKLVSARTPRIIIRKSLNNFIIQLVDFDPKGDKVLTTVSSARLKDYGWNAHTGNMPAAYLTGLLFGNNLKNKNFNAILDLGLYRSIKKSSIYAALKGVIDSGIKVKYSEEVLPLEGRITGKHISDYAKLIKNNGKYQKQFSNYAKNNFDALNFENHFKEVKNKILGKA
mgnify:CR=1 FL=1